MSGEVDALRADVDRRLAETADRVTATLKAEAQADRAAFDSLRTEAPTREAVWEALERAQWLTLTVARRPPRVNVSRLSRVYVAFAIDTGDPSDEPLELHVEGVGGATEDWVPWPVDREAHDVLVEVGRALYKHTGETPDTRALLAGLADLLDAALSHPDRRPAIELCPPQWMVCDWGVVTYGSASTRGADKAKLRASSTIHSHFAEKSWVDQDSWEDAYEVAAALWPTTDPWGTPMGTEPPLLTSSAVGRSGRSAAQCV